MAIAQIAIISPLVKRGVLGIGALTRNIIWRIIN
jgi:hypothetical protein